MRLARICNFSDLISSGTENKTNFRFFNQIFLLSNQFNWKYSKWHAEDVQPARHQCKDGEFSFRGSSRRFSWFSPRRMLNVQSSSSAFFLAICLVFHKNRRKVIILWAIFSYITCIDITLIAAVHVGRLQLTLFISTHIDGDDHDSHLVRNSAWVIVMCLTLVSSSFAIRISSTQFEWWMMWRS